LAATCNIMNKIVRAQYYANEVCNVVQLIAALVAKFYCRRNIFSCSCKTLHVAFFIAVV